MWKRQSAEKNCGQNSFKCIFSVKLHTQLELESNTDDDYFFFGKKIEILHFQSKIHLLH